MSVYALRHAEKAGRDGVITPVGEAAARALRGVLPDFVSVYSSDLERAIVTVRLLTGMEPTVDPRAGFYMGHKEVGDTIYALANDQGISFYEASLQYKNAAQLAGIAKQAAQFNQLVDELLARPDKGDHLIVSHDLTISPAMVRRGMKPESIAFLSGYIIDDVDRVSRFTPPPIVSTNSEA